MHNRISYPKSRTNKEYDKLRICMRCKVGVWLNEKALAVGKLYHTCGSFMRRASVEECKQGLITLVKHSLGATSYETSEPVPRGNIVIEIKEDRTETKIVREPTQEEIRRVLLGKHYK